MSQSEIKKSLVTIGDQHLEGILRDPENSVGLVIFAHGAGSSRLSPRNNYVAECLGQRGISTLLFDLLTEDEASDRAKVFDIDLLSTRLLEAIEWAGANLVPSGKNIAIFGASTGAAAALVAAASAPSVIAAVVSRGGRADLAGEALSRVRAPTLLIVGGADHGVIELNRQAALEMTCEHKTVLVSGATHLFAEPGALDQVVDLAAEWFVSHLSKIPALNDG